MGALPNSKGQKQDLLLYGLELCEMYADKLATSDSVSAPDLRIAVHAMHIVLENYHSNGEPTIIAINRSLLLQLRMRVEKYAAANEERLPLSWGLRDFISHMAQASNGPTESTGISAEQLRDAKMILGRLRYDSGFDK